MRGIVETAAGAAMEAARHHKSLIHLALAQERIFHRRSDLWNLPLLTGLKAAGERQKWKNEEEENTRQL